MTESFSHYPKSRSGGAQAFTLVELLVAMGVLLLMLVLFTQAIGGISSAWRGAEERMNNHTKARALLGRLQTDIDTMVLRDDLPAFPVDGADTKFGFFTLRRGVYNGTSASDARSLSYVEYNFDSNSRYPGRLLRFDKSYDYTDGEQSALEFGSAIEVGPGETPAPNATPDRGEEPPTESEAGLADGILGFEWAFLRHDGGFSSTLDYTDSTGVRRTAKGVAVAMLVMDERAMDGLENVANGALANLKDDLARLQNNADSPNWDPKKEWEDMLGLRPGSSGRVAQDYPSRFLQGVRAFERVYLFPKNNN